MLRNQGGFAGSRHGQGRRLLLLLVASLEAQVLVSTAPLRAGHAGGAHAAASGRPSAGGNGHRRTSPKGAPAAQPGPEPGADGKSQR
jgi:hypothetical protein